MTQLINCLKLVALVLQRGKIRPRGVDFTSRRRETLQNLTDFVPRERWRAEEPAQSVRTSWLSGLSGQAAFLKESLTLRGGHLAAASRDKLCYVRIPRAASTSLSYAMLASRYPALGEISLSPEQINFLTDANLDVTIAEADKKATYFTVVRNPLSRIVSVYRQFFEHPSTSFLYEDYLFGILKKGFSFGEFVKTLEKIPTVFMDQHIRPQHRFLSFYEDRNVDVKIFKLEEPEPLRNFLTGRGLHLQPLNPSDAGYDYHDYYDHELFKTVHKMYISDVIRFGYQDDYKC